MNIIYLHENIGGKTGKAIRLSQGFTVLQTFLSGPNAAAANEEIEQARGLNRFVFSRIFGRVN